MMEYKTDNIDLISFKQRQENHLDMSDCSDDGAAILTRSDRRKPASKREPLRRMNSGGRLRNVRKAWGDFKSKIKIPKKGMKHTNWNVPQCSSPENRPQIVRTPKSMTKQKLLDIAYSPDFFRTPEHCRIYRESNSTTPGTARGEFLRRSIRIANRTPTPCSQKSHKSRVKPRRIQASTSNDFYHDVNDIVQRTRTMTTMSSAVDCYKGMAIGLADSIEKSETVEGTSKPNGKSTKKNTRRSKRQKTPPQAK